MHWVQGSFVDANRFWILGVVVVKWSACSPSNQTIRVRILLTPTVLSVKFEFEKSLNTQKEARVGPFKKTDSEFCVSVVVQVPLKKFISLLQLAAEMKNGLRNFNFKRDYCLYEAGAEASKQAVWPDWAIHWTLGNFVKPLATINFPKSPTFLSKFYKGDKIYHFSSEIIFWQLL